MPEKDKPTGSVSYTAPNGAKVTAIPSKYIPRMLRVAIYCRVSTLHDDQLNSLEAQLDYYRNYVQSRVNMVLVGEYADIRSGRSTDDRAQFSAMIQDCLAGKIDLIVTKSISRFGRNTVDTLTVLRQLKAANVDVYFENENIHSLDPDGELIISLASAIAQAESEERSKNIKWGIRQSATNPDSAIYSRPCYGYRKDRSGQLIIHEEEADVVRLVYDLYLSGESVVAIIRILKQLQVETPRGKDTWSKRAIETMLKNEKYAGDVIVYKTYCDEYPKKKRIVNKGQTERFMVEDHHEAIIPKETFEAVQAEIIRRSNVEEDEDGNTRRKSTHYSTKQRFRMGFRDIEE